MIELKSCLRCGSENVDKVTVNTRISLNYPEERSIYTGTITQRIINPTDALVCKECGHIELFVDLENKI